MHNIHDEFKWIPRKKRWRINNKQHIATNTMPIEESDTFIEHCYSSAIAKGQRSTYPSRRWPSFETCTRGSRRGRKSQKKSRLSYRQPTDDTLHWLIIASWLSKFHCCSFYLLLLAPLLNRGDDKGLGGATVSTCADSICRRLARSSPHPFQIWRPWRPARWLARKAKKKSAGKKTRPAFFYPPETRMAAHKRNSDENKSEE